MKPYLSIGKVSRLKNVSIKSLRYYDRIGILKPAFINTETNYRYYTEEQLYLLDAITLCIKLGIPLKDLNRYVENDSINLQKLLYDGKILAEEKIMEIHQCLEALQETLRRLSISESGMAKIPESKAGLLLPDGFYQNTLGARTILTVPLEEFDTPKYYGQHILKLFVTAQQAGINVSYPSGILYEYRDGALVRHMFLLVHTEEGQVLPESEAIRTLPAGNYICRKISTHMAGSVQAEMKEVLKGSSYSIIETDTSSARNKKNGYPYELQYLAE
ncbi:MAG: MerR family transcriptional regulator [Blautia sp.]|nr:MerR family transcriptional regulator [Blautia sp.]MCM1200125.1 MerR family transcriptional regulator [Bacteroides fragilis]